MSAEITPATAAQILAEAEAKWAKRVEQLEADKHDLWLGLRLAHDAMVTWYSSEYADSPQAKTIRLLIDRHYSHAEPVRKDVDRLDWLAAHQASINQTAQGPHVWNGREPADNDNHFYGSTYREAIDAAMKGTV